VTGAVPPNIPSSTRSSSAAAVFFPSTTPNPANINPPILPNNLNAGDSILSLPVGSQNTSLLGQNEKGSAIFRNMMPNNGYLPNDAVMNQNNPAINAYNGLAMNNTNPMLNHGMNPVPPNMGNSALNLNGVANTMSQSNVMQQHQNQQQPAYFVQQAVYVDQNGQPIYYRPGLNLPFIFYFFHFNNKNSSQCWSISPRICVFHCSRRYPHDVGGRGPNARELYPLR
jgi:hypothetical protein